MDTMPTESAKDLEGVAGECGQCGARVVFGDHGRAGVSTGWVWDSAQGGHIRPVCVRCKAARKPYRAG